MPNISEILDGNAFESPLHSLKLVGTDGACYEGSGYVTWSPETGLSLKAIRNPSTNGFEDPMPSFRPVQLIPRDQFLKLEAKAIDSWTVRAENILAYMPKPCAEAAYWDQPLPFAKFSCDYENQEGGAMSLCAKLEHVEKVEFCRYTKITSDNPRFPGGRTSLDWLEFSTSFGSVAIRKDKDGRLLIQIEENNNLADIERCLESVRLAICFVEGRSVRVLAFGTYNGRRETVTLHGEQKSTRGSFPSLLKGRAISGPGDGFESFLGLVTSFFHTENGRGFSDHLRMCWDVQDNFGSIRVAVTCSKIEKMIRLLRGGLKPARPANDAQRLTQESQSFAQAKIKKYLCKRQLKYGERFVKRVHQIKPNDELNVKAVLGDWKDRGLIGITREEISAWEELRHAVSHGDLVYMVTEFESRRVIFDKLKCLENLVNKLSLQATGYQGSYYDHTRRMPTTFMAVSAEELQGNARHKD